MASTHYICGKFTYTGQERENEKTNKTKSSREREKENRRGLGVSSPSAICFYRIMFGFAAGVCISSSPSHPDPGTEFDRIWISDCIFVCYNLSHSFFRKGQRGPAVRISILLNSMLSHDRFQNDGIYESIISFHFNLSSEWK